MVLKLETLHEKRKTGFPSFLACEQAHKAGVIGAEYLGGGAALRILQQIP